MGGDAQHATRSRRAAVEPHVSGAVV